MKPIRKILAALVIAGASVTSANAGIPVIDAANLASAIEQVVAWGQQFQQMQQQYNSMRAQFESMNGSRGIAGLLQNPQLYEYLPRDFTQVLTSNGGGGMNATSMVNSLKLYGIEQTSINPNSPAGKLFQAGQNQNAVFRMLGEQGYKAMNDRLTQLSSLTSSIDAAQDPKAIADLNARIASEQAFIANEQSKLAVMAQLQAAQDRIRQQQGREILMKATTGDVPRF